MMYYFLLLEVIKTRTSGKIPTLLGDHVSRLLARWKRIQKTLIKRLQPHIPTRFRDSKKNKDLLKQLIKERMSLPQEDSKKHAFIQLADVITGGMRHTWYSKQYHQWKNSRRSQHKKEYIRPISCILIEKFLNSNRIKYNPKNVHAGDEGIMNYPYIKPRTYSSKGQKKSYERKASYKFLEV